MTNAEISEGRYSRQIELFGTAGQDRISNAAVAVLGLGGLGCHVAQQLAYLGVRRLILADHDEVEDRNLNRLIGANHDDVGRPKVEVAKRMVEWIQPAAEVTALPFAMPNPQIDSALRSADLIIGCFDNDYPRMLTTDAASAAGLPYIDAATGIDADSIFYGGRVLVAGQTPGCLHCHRLLDQTEIRRATMTDDELAVEAKIYGIPIEQLRASGPSVVSFNGAVASVAVTEAMAILTGLRAGHKLQTYAANLGRMTTSGDQPTENCFYCQRWISRSATYDVRPCRPLGLK